jgi:hypothetical protein
MMIFQLLLGVVIVVWANVEAFWTVLSLQGGGPMTGWLTRGVWSVCLRLPRPLLHRLMPGIGTTIVMLTLTLWIALLWLGWWVLFSADPGSVVESITKQPVGGWGRFYFTGFTVFTLGVGDYVASNDMWRVVTAVASGSGLILITLSITYLVPVVSAVTGKRRVAGTIAGLGTTPHELLLHAWDGRGFDGLSQPLSSIQSEVEDIHQKHGAYPVLHYFHNRQRREQIALMLAVLDEAIQLLRSGVAESVRPRWMLHEPTRAAIGELLLMLEDDFVQPASEPPPITPLHALREAGVPVVSEERYETAMHQERDRRRRVHGFVQDAGWSWSDVIDPKCDATQEATPR